MSASTSDSQSDNSDDSLQDEFKDERRNRVLLGVAILVLGAVVTFGILYFFGAVAPSGW